MVWLEKQDITISPTFILLMNASRICFPIPWCILQFVSSEITGPYPSHPIRMYPLFIQSRRTGLSPVPASDTFHTTASEEIPICLSFTIGRVASSHNFLKIPFSIS